MSKRTTRLALSGNFSRSVFKLLAGLALLICASAVADPWGQFGHFESSGAKVQDAKNSGPDSPWPSVFEDAGASQIEAYGCRTETSMPGDRPLTRLGFPAYATKAPASGNGAELLRLAARVAGQGSDPVYVVGTSFSRDEKPHRLMALAISRARSVAQALAAYGVDPHRLVCVPLAGPEPPQADWDKSVLIFAGRS